MNSPQESFVDAGGRRCRVWRSGQGKAVFWLASAPLLYRWTDIHQALSAQAQLVVCSLPGFPGNGRNHDDIDHHLEWCLTARDLLKAAGFKRGDTLMGSSTAGALAADVAAIWPDEVEQLVLVAPHGIFDKVNPSRDLYALHPREAASLISANPSAYKAQIAAPNDMQAVLWSIEVARANEAAARILWPLSDTQLIERLPRVTARSCIVWGEQDQIMPPSYAKIFAANLPTAQLVMVPNAGHVVELDAPLAVATAVLQFVNDAQAAPRAN